MRARELSAATLGGTVAGIAAGLLARIAMRAVALIRGVPVEISVFGTVGIVIVFVMMALAVATVFTWRRGRQAGVGTGPAMRWSLAGFGLFGAVVIVTPLRQEIVAPLELLLFIPAAIVLGAGPVWLSRALGPALPEPRTARARAAYRALALPAVLATLVLPLMLLAGVLQVIGVIPVPTS